MQIRIMIMSGCDDGREIILEGKGDFSIGRRETCDVCIPFDTSVSRLHAHLRHQVDGLWLVDEQSRNGTFIGRRRVKEPEPLQVGELFRIGNTWMRIQEYKED